MINLIILHVFMILTGYVENRELVKCTCIAQISLQCVFEDGEQFMSSNCTKFDLSSKSITKIRDGALTYDMIEYLNLENNFIKTIPEDMDDHFASNGELNLKNNCIGPYESAVIVSNFKGNFGMNLMGNPTNCIENKWIIEHMKLNKIKIICETDNLVIEQANIRCNKQNEPDDYQSTSCALIKLLQVAADLKDNIDPICEDIQEKTGNGINPNMKEEYKIEMPSTMTFSDRKQLNTHIEIKKTLNDIPSYEF